MTKNEINDKDCKEQYHGQHRRAVITCYGEHKAHIEYSRSEKIKSSSLCSKL